MARPADHVTIAIVKEGDTLLDEDGEIVHYDLKRILWLAKNVSYCFAKRKTPDGPMILFGRARMKLGDGDAFS